MTWKTEIMENAKISEIQPVLLVNDMNETLAYYKKLGFKIDWTWPQEGEPNHASVSLGFEGGEEHSHDHVHIQLSSSDQTPVSTSGWLSFQVSSDIDSLYRHFRKVGAEIVSELTDQPWGMREFDIKEINGHRFRFGKPSPHTEE